MSRVMIGEDEAAFEDCCDAMTKIAADHGSDAVPAMLDALMCLMVQNGVGDEFRKLLNEAMEATGRAEKVWRENLS